jgi:hypothetical protein
MKGGTACKDFFRVADSVYAASVEASSKRKQTGGVSAGIVGGGERDAGSTRSDSGEREEKTDGGRLGWHRRRRCELNR